MNAKSLERSMSFEAEGNGSEDFQNGPMMGNQMEVEQTMIQGSRAEANWTQCGRE